jgi:hypothetical protein
MHQIAIGVIISGPLSQMYTIQMSLCYGEFLNLGGLDFNVIIFEATLGQTVENVRYMKGTDVEPMILPGGSTRINSSETGSRINNVSRREKCTFTVSIKLAGCTEGGVDIHRAY